MKNILSKISLLLIFFFTLSTIITARSKISTKEVYLVNGTNKTIQIINVFNKVNNKVKWTSFDKKIAIVDEKGNIKARGIGNTTIKGHYGTKSLKCNVFVMDISQKEIELAPKDSALLKVQNAIDTVRWSSDDKIISVSSKGQVTAEQPGIANVQAICQKQKMNTKVYIPIIVLDKNGYKTGETGKASLKYAFSKDIKFQSLNSDIIEMQEDGTFLVKKPGTAQITAETFQNNKSVAKLENTVNTYDISSSQLILKPGEEKEIKIINGDKAEWTSSNPKIAVIDDTGKVKGIKNGSCEITGKINDVTFNCKILVSNIKLDKSYFKVGDNGKVSFSAKKKIQYSSSDPKVIKINKKGEMTAVAKGEAEIIGKIIENKTTLAEFKEPVYVCEIEKPSYIIKTDTSKKVSINNLPDVKWTSSDENIASVDKEGNISAKNPGTCEIVGSAHDLSFNTKVYVPEPTETDIVLTEKEDGKNFSLKNVDQEVKYETSDDTVAVYKDGKIIPLKPGNCVITASVDDVSFECNVLVNEKPEKVTQFLSLLESYHQYIKAHYDSFENDYTKATNTFTEAKNKVEEGDVVGLTCVIPCKWGLHEMGIRTGSGKSLVAGIKGTFGKYYSGNVPDNFEYITSGGAIGKTAKEAIDKGLLKPGDICAYDNLTHTFVYSGEGYYFYEGGGLCDDYSRGIKMDYSKGYKHREFSEILRWKE